MRSRLSAALHPNRNVGRLARELAAIVLVGLAPACQQDEDPPDLVAIASDYCTIIQMCDPDRRREDQEACEAYSAEEYEQAKTEDRACYDARIVMETCIGGFGSCDEYNSFKYTKDGGCKKEYSDYYIACELQ